MEYRAKVRCVVDVAGLEVRPKSSVGAFLKVLHGCVYCHRGVRSVRDGADAGSRVILLDPAMARPSSAALSDLPDAIVSRIDPLMGTPTVVTVTVVPRIPVTLTYENFTMPELLKKLLPPGVVALSGFEQVGHIAHVNLQAAHIPFQATIGQVILDTNTTVKTVVNKVDCISSVYREFKMEVIAGSPNLNAVVRQNGFVFHVPYDKVYWNSRLGEEHARLVRLMQPKDELFDVMAGIGPFAIPAAAAGVCVYANDLNPASYAALKENAAQNSVAVDAFNMDGRAFIETVVRQQHLEQGPLPHGNRRHLSMNLPALAVAFLDTFTTPAWRSGAVVDRQPVIHCYTFSAAAEVKADAVRQVENVLGTSLSGFVELVHDVRDVAPTKQMVCVSFRLPLALTEAIPPPASECDAQRKKRDREE